jgi:hypothetical protein
MIIDELVSRDLARPSEDGVSVPMHPVVRTTILVLLAQLARDAGRRAGIGLHPTATNWRAIRDLLTVRRPAPPTLPARPFPPGCAPAEIHSRQDQSQGLTGTRLSRRAYPGSQARPIFRGSEVVPVASDGRRILGTRALRALEAAKKFSPIVNCGFVWADASGQLRVWRAEIE